jgi:heme/copper-type cytochrome/quinol oxidase subunit 2
MNVTISRRTLGVLLIGTGACLLTGPAVLRIFAQPARGQEQAPNRREFMVTAKDYRFAPSRIEVAQDDLVKVTVHSEDIAYSLTIDEYRLSKRVPAGGTTTIEFRADRAGTFAFYSNLTSDSRHAQMRGELVVRGR